MISSPIVLALFGCGASDPAPPTPPHAPPIARSAAPTEDRYAASHILISFAGAARAPESARSRTEADAEELARQLHDKIAAGASFDDLARRYSEGPSAPRGGRLGVYRTNTMMPTFETAVAGVHVGAVTAPFRTPFGWHIARRDAVVEARGQHILIKHAGAWRSDSTRLAVEARTLVSQIAAELEAGADFATLARAHSEDATAIAGGDLGLIAPGQLVPEFEDALFELEIGGRSGVVQTPYGFHVIRRTE